MILGIGAVLCIIFLERDGADRSAVLEEKLSAADGSLMVSGGDQFGISGFTYGQDFSASVGMLQLEEWFPEERVRDITTDAAGAEGACNVRYSDTDLVFTAFGGVTYTLGFHLSRSLKCYMLDFTARFEEPRTMGAALGGPAANEMPYEDASRYFYGLLDAFESAYGSPADQDTAQDLRDVKGLGAADGVLPVGNYATWRTSGPLGASVLHLYARPIRDSYDGVLTLTVYVYVGAEIGDVSLEEILEELPR